MTPDPTPNPDPDDAPQGDDGEASKFAVYDHDLGQFVTVDGETVHPSKSKAGKAKTAAGRLRRHDGHKLTVRSVG